MKILHTGDWHVAEGERLENTLEALDAMITDAIAEGVELALVAGDLTGTTVPHVATIRERCAVGDRLNRLAEQCDVVVVYGNHDAPGDLDIYARPAPRCGHGFTIHVVAAPMPLVIYDMVAVVYCLPYPSKRWYAASADVARGALGLEAQKADVEQNLRAILDAWKADVGVSSVTGTRSAITCPRIMVAHINIGGSHTGGGECLIGREIELAPHDLDELDMDYVALSHIHLHQRMADHAWYAGSPTSQNHGETEFKGYVIVDVVAGGDPVVDFRRTPARRLVTVQVEWGVDDMNDGAPHVIADDIHDDATGADVRVLVHVSEEHRPSVDIGAIERYVAPPGHPPWRTTIEIRTKPRARVRSTAITTAVTLTDKVAAFWQTIPNPPDEATRPRVLEKLARLERGEL